jgi:outer membrane protein assembly factor BamB
MPGYTLFAPLTADSTYLIDLDGNVVRTWKSDYLPSAWVYLLDNGHLLRGGRELETHGFSGGGQGGRFQEFNFDGALLWDYSLNTEDRLPHHDVTVLPNGNIVAIVWERKSLEEARRAGRHAEFTPEDGVWSDVLVELEPQRPNGARIVWEWHVWDHIIQNVDARLENYGVLSEHPELVDINGDTVGIAKPPENPSHDVFHLNSIDYNPELDQIIVSAPTFNEIWVIDHGTTTEQAAGGSGGRAGRGGDLLYRWGNPQVYDRGGEADRRLGFEHDARWIPLGRPGAGNITVFSNQTPGASGTYTQIYEIRPPIDGSHRYAISARGAFGPQEPVWTYSAPGSFSATYISGAERLANGNTLISSGPQGRLFEVTSTGEIVWEYWSPYWDKPEIGGAGAGRNPFSIFRAVRIPADHPALSGRRLMPLDPQPAVRPPPDASN